MRGLLESCFVYRPSALQSGVIGWTHQMVSPTRPDCCYPAKALKMALKQALKIRSLRWFRPGLAKS